MAMMKACSVATTVSVFLLLLSPLLVGAGGILTEDMTPVDDVLSFFPENTSDIRKNLVKFDSVKLEQDRQARMERQRERREKAREKLASIKPDLSKMRQLSTAELKEAEAQEHPWVRKAGWSSSNTNSFGGMVDPSSGYDKWQQAYRMLGGFIDCDHSKSDDDHKSGDGGDEQEDNGNACSRWMMWASVSTNFVDYHSWRAVHI